MNSKTSWLVKLKRMKSLSFYPFVRNGSPSTGQRREQKQVTQGRISFFHIKATFSDKEIVVRKAPSPKIKASITI